MRRLLALLVLSAAVACGGDSSTNPSATLTGSYSLRTVNGSPVPYTVIQIGADKYEIVSDVVTLNEGGTWSESGTDRTTQSGQVTTGTITDNGTYTVNGTAITLISSQSGTVTGAVGAGTLTLTAEGIVLVYQK